MRCVLFVTNNILVTQPERWHCRGGVGTVATAAVVPRGGGFFTGKQGEATQSYYICGRVTQLLKMKKKKYLICKLILIEIKAGPQIHSQTVEKMKQDYTKIETF